MSKEQPTKLERYLASRGLTATNLSDLTKEKFEIGVGKDRISNFVNGNRDLLVMPLLKLCGALKCTPNDILDFEEYLED